MTSTAHGRGWVPTQGISTSSGLHSSTMISGWSCAQFALQTEIQTCLSPGKSPAAQRCTACLETSAAILRNEHREHAKNFKSSINSNRNGEDERKEDSASRKRNRWLLWSKKYNRKKWSSRTLFEGVKRQGGSLEKAKPRSWELNGGH